MKILLGVVLPFLLQVLLVYVIILMNTGNGSWLGLGAFLIGMIAIPGTAIVNFVHIRNHPALHVVKVARRCLLNALIAPVVVLAFFLFF